MHIPTCETGEIEIADFAPALAQALEPAADYDVQKWLFVPNKYDEYRYILGTRGENPLICYGINPSTAAPDALDNTLKSAERIALFNGFDSFIMLNVYAQRATNPDDMEKQRAFARGKQKGVCLCTKPLQRRPPDGLGGVGQYCGKAKIFEFVFARDYRSRKRSQRALGFGGKNLG